MAVLKTRCEHLRGDLPMIVEVGSGHDQVHQMLVLRRQEVLQCRQKDAAASSHERKKGTRAGADGVGDILGGWQVAEDAIVDNQRQAVEARELRHSGGQTQGLQTKSWTARAVGEIVEVATVRVFAGVAP